MKVKELRTRNAQDLEKLETELTEELFRLRFRRGAGQLQNTARLAKVRQELAQVKTIQHEKRSAV